MKSFTFRLDQKVLNVKNVEKKKKAGVVFLSPEYTLALGNVLTLSDWVGDYNGGQEKKISSYTASGQAA